MTAPLEIPCSVQVWDYSISKSVLALHTFTIYDTKISIEFPSSPKIFKIKIFETPILPLLQNFLNLPYSKCACAYSHKVPILRHATVAKWQPNLSLLPLFISVVIITLKNHLQCLLLTLCE